MVSHYGNWSTHAFAHWLSISGLSMENAAKVFGKSERSIQRLKAGHVGISKAVVTTLKQFDDQSRQHTSDVDGELMDSYAVMAELPEICMDFPYAYVTCLSSAIGRGWTSANSNSFLQLGQPERMPRPSRWRAVVELEFVPAVDLPWGVEMRDALDGAPISYRVASPERTLLELAQNEPLFGEDAIGECFHGAFHLSHQAPDRELLLMKAREWGGDNLFDLVGHYLRNHAKV